MDKKIKIAFLDIPGVKFDGDTLEKRGLGGSESAMLIMSKELAKLNFDVTVFCNIETQEGIFDNVNFIDVSKTKNNTEKFDIVVSTRCAFPFIPMHLREEALKEFKSFSDIVGVDKIDPANYLGLIENSKYKVLWLHDTFCWADPWVEHLCLDGFIDKIFTLSDWHSDYIMNGHSWRYRFYEVLKHKIFETRNGVRNFIKEVDISAKDKNLFVYNAAVSKGLPVLLNPIWTKIREKIPEARLEVIGGYYKGAGRENGPDLQEQNWTKLQETYDGKNGVHFTGVISPEEVAKIVSKSTLMIYPNTSPETFGISTLEAINYNTPVVTCRFGALEEVAAEQTSYLINYNMEYDSNQIDRFLNLFFKAYNDNYLRQQKMQACNEFKPYITWDTIALQWKQHFYNALDLYMPLNELKKVENINKKIQQLFQRRFLNKEDVVEISKEKRRIVVVAATYNSAEYIEKCINSVANQLYDNYMMYIVNDISTDETGKIIKDTLNNLPYNLQRRFVYVDNVIKNYAVANQQYIIEEHCKSQDIVVLLDGDDWLVNDPHIFDYLDNIYSEGYDMTYGSCHSLCDNINLIAQPYPQEIHNNKEYRKFLFNWGMPYTHLRTFTKEVFNRIDKSLLRTPTRDYWQAGGDNSLFYALLENARNIKCIQKILMVYNDVNPLNDYKVNSQEQIWTAEFIRSYDLKEKKYEMPYKSKLIEQIIEPMEIPAIGEKPGFKMDEQYATDFYQKIARQENIDQNLNSKSTKIVMEKEPVIKSNKKYITEFYQLFDGDKLNIEPSPFAVFTSDPNNLPKPKQETIKVKEKTEIENSELISKIATAPIQLIPKTKFEIKTPQDIINSNKKLKILIGLPTAKNIETATFKSIYNLIKPDNVELIIEFFFGYNIDQVRNLMAHYTIMNKFDYIFCVDSDVVLPKDSLVKLLSHNKEIISGIYRQRKMDEKIIEIYVEDNHLATRIHPDNLPTEVMEVVMCGFGCTLIKRELLELVGYPQFEYHHTIDFKDTISEDSDFCKKARAKGVRIYVDPTVKCGHMADFELLI